MIYFTADTHFGHAAVIRLCNRPFATIEEMDGTLVANWNAVVRPKDEVYHLGDFAFTDPGPIVRRLNGRIHLVLGNHDIVPKVTAAGRFASIRDVGWVRWEGRRFFLSHYSHRVWRKSGRGSFHLFGHSHGALPRWGRSMDVGVDAVGFAPIPITQVYSELEGALPIDHHDAGTLPRG